MALLRKWVSADTFGYSPSTLRHLFGPFGLKHDDVVQQDCVIPLVAFLLPQKEVILEDRDALFSCEENPFSP